MATIPLPLPTSDEAGERLPMLMLHHVGIVVGDVHRASEEYRSTLGYEVCTEVIHDPLQTAYVRFLRRPGDQVYVELVSPDGERSKLANALRKGGGLNHLCFATNDIARSWATLRTRGLFPLQAPVPAVAFGGRRIAWFLGRDRMPLEVVERGGPGEL
jgi:methylmalonyl-CoA/ethylmalonyl-CoA epimerase